RGVPPGCVDGRHCPGALEDTDPFCRLQSHALLERLDELGELKAALAANGCDRRATREAGAEGRASPVHVSTIPALPVDHPRTVGSFDDNWPWPRRPTFLAGVAATAGFKIRKCQEDADCEW
ncbi:MAG TPA: hypothetical protein VLQ79_00300, partial [Myxococcaceae bacterium]|nr:hypothetical protein [Myxococcaceae bacterium]